MKEGNYMIVNINIVSETLLYGILVNQFQFFRCHCTYICKYVFRELVVADYKKRENVLKEI